MRETLLDIEEDEDDLEELQSEDESIPEEVMQTPRPAELPEPFEVRAFILCGVTRNTTKLFSRAKPDAHALPQLFPMFACFASVPMTVLSTQWDLASVTVTGSVHKANKVLVPSSFFFFFFFFFFLRLTF